MGIILEKGVNILGPLIGTSLVFSTLVGLAVLNLGCSMLSAIFFASGSYMGIISISAAVKFGIEQANK